MVTALLHSLQANHFCAYEYITKCCLFIVKAIRHCHESVFVKIKLLLFYPPLKSIPACISLSQNCDANPRTKDSVIVWSIWVRVLEIWFPVPCITHWQMSIKINTGFLVSVAVVFSFLSLLVVVCQFAVLLVGFFCELSCDDTSLHICLRECRTIHSDACRNWFALSVC